MSDYVLEGVLKHDADTFSENVARAKFRLQYDCESLYKPVGVTEADILARYTENKVYIGGIESQIVHWADKIAYMGHDWEEFVSVDLLEVMLSRINKMVIELDHYYAELSRIESDTEANAQISDDLWETVIRDKNISEFN